MITEYNADDLMQSILECPDNYTKEKIKSIGTKDEWLMNCALNAYEYATHATDVLSWPIDIILPITERCNARCLFCKYCPHENWFMPVEDIEFYDVLLKKVKNFGFSAYGEPLLHPDFSTLAQLVKSRIDPRATTYLVTNGSQLNQHLDTVKRYCNSVSVSLNAATAKTHEKVMHLDNKFEQIIEAIEDLIIYRDYYDAKFIVQLSFVVIKDNIHEIPNFIKLAQRLRANKIYFNNLNIATETELNSKGLTKDHYKALSPTNAKHFDILSAKAIKALDEARIEVQADPSGWHTTSLCGEDHEKNVFNGISCNLNCSYLYQRLMITDKNRTIRTCCFLESPPGYNKIFFKNPLKFHQYWNHDGLKAMRKAFVSGNLPVICRHCTGLNKNIFR